LNVHSLITTTTSVRQITDSSTEKRAASSDTPGRTSNQQPCPAKPSGATGAGFLGHLHRTRRRTRTAGGADAPLTPMPSSITRTALRGHRFTGRSGRHPACLAGFLVCARPMRAHARASDYVSHARFVSARSGRRLPAPLACRRPPGSHTRVRGLSAADARAREEGT